MRIFVHHNHGETLMPCKSRKAKFWLRNGRANVISRSTFTIQPLHGSVGCKQDLVLGVDTGHQEVGVSVT